MSFQPRAFPQTQKIKEQACTKNIKELQFFLGLASYYRLFIHHFAKKAWCLHKLVGPTANMKKKKASAKRDDIGTTKPKQKTFKWIDKAWGGIWCTEGSTQYCSLQ